jgi:thiol-disulfide isomerase/thioredoxin
MKLFILGISVFVLIFSSCDRSLTERNKNGEVVLKGNVKLEEGVGNFGIEIFAFPEDIRFPDKKDLIKKTTADEKGNFTLVLPDSIQFYNIHFTAPNYVTYQSAFSILDKKSYIDVILRPNAVSTKFKKLNIYGDFNLWNWKTMADMTMKDSNHYEIIIDYGKPEMMYEIKFDCEEHTYPNIVEGASYEYDYGGDHRTKVKSDSGKYHIIVDLNNYTFYDNKKDRPKSEGHFINSPVNEIYPVIKSKLGRSSLSKLSQYFFIVVKQSNPDYLKGWSKEDIERTTKSTLKKYDEYLKLADSLLKTVKNSYLKDYLLGAKIDLLFMKDSVDYDEAWSLFEQIGKIPEEHDDCFTRFICGIYGDNFEKNPEKIMNGIEKKIYLEKDENFRANLLYNYYRSFESKIEKDSTLRNKVITGLENMKELSIEEEWLKEAVPKMLARIKLQEMKMAPDFDFTLINAQKSKLSMFKGDWVLLHFWSVHCGWCVSETKYLVEAHEKFKNKNFSIISIADCPDIKGTVDYIDKNNMDWYHSITLEEYAKNAEMLYGVNGVPTLFLISPEGELKSGSDVDLRGTGLIPTLEKYIGM